MFVCRLSKPANKQGKSCSRNTFCNWWFRYVPRNNRSGLLNHRFTLKTFVYFVVKTIMTNFSPSLDFTKQLDSQDPLASYRDQFVITDPDLVYLDGNSLGMMPRVAQERAKQVVEEQWGNDLIRGWNKGWWDAPQRVGDKIGQLIGAAEGQTLVNDTVSLNLYKLVMAALTYQPDKKRIITDTLNFPSDFYIFQGIVKLLAQIPSPSGEG